MCPDHNILAHEDFIWRSLFVYSLEGPFGDISNPRILKPGRGEGYFNSPSSSWVWKREECLVVG